MMAWALVVAFQGEPAPAVYLQPTENDCRGLQIMLREHSKRIGKPAEIACYVITPTPDSVIHPKAKLVPKENRGSPR